MNNKKDYEGLRNRATKILEWIDNQPLRINVIYYAARGQLKETAHCMILAGLFQEKVILDDFLETFMPSSYKGGSSNYEINRELYHIDVSLENKSNYIIIENKVNDAAEQQSQIFRYVNEVKKTNKDIYVIYLNSVTRNSPTKRSLSGNDGKCVFDLIQQDHFVVLSYLYDILPWLKKLEENFVKKQENRYIKTAIFQYIDYLEMKFNARSFDEMRGKIDELLKINSKYSEDVRMSVYNEELSLLEAYRNNISTVKMEMVKKEAQKWEDKLTEYWGNEIQLEEHKDDDKTGFVFSIWDGKIKIVFTSSDCKPWWGIHVEETENELREKIKEEMEKNFEHLETNNPNWHLWRWTTFSGIMIEAKCIHDALKNLEKDTSDTIL